MIASADYPNSFAMQIEPTRAFWEVHGGASTTLITFSIIGMDLPSAGYPDQYPSRAVGSYVLISAGACPRSSTNGACEGCRSGHRHTLFTFGRRIFDG